MATHSSSLACRIPGERSLVGCRLWGCTESDPPEATQQQQQADPLPSPFLSLPSYEAPGVTDLLVPEAGLTGDQPAHGPFLSRARLTRTIEFAAVQLLSHVRLRNPTGCHTLGFPALHSLSEFAQTHVH